MIIGGTNLTRPIPKGKSKPAPMTTLVRHSMHKMGIIFSSCSWFLVHQHNTIINNFELLTFRGFFSLAFFFSPDLYTTLPLSYPTNLAILFIYILSLPTNYNEPLYLLTI
jgi:hypothetical protein